MSRRGTALAAALLAAGCSHHDPRADAALFENAGERTRRDVAALYFWDDPGVGTGSILVTRRGTAEVHVKPGPALQSAFSRMGRRQPDLHRHDVGIPVAPADLAALDRAFASAPPGESAWAVPQETAPADAFDRPAVETVGTRYRALHVSGAGELRTVTLTEGPRDRLPEGLRPAGPDLAGLRKLFMRIVNPDSPVLK